MEEKLAKAQRRIANLRRRLNATEMRRLDWTIRLTLFREELKLQPDNPEVRLCELELFKLDFKQKSLEAEFCAAHLALDSLTVSAEIEELKRQRSLLSAKEFNDRRERLRKVFASYKQRADTGNTQALRKNAREHPKQRGNDGPSIGD